MRSYLKVEFGEVNMGKVLSNPDKDWEWISLAYVLEINF